MKTAVQLYSLRSVSDYLGAGVLGKLAEAGCEGVEGFGMAGMEPAAIDALAQALRTTGLVMASVHVMMQDLQEQFDYWLSLFRKLEVKWAVVPWFEAEKLDEAAIAETAAAFNDMQVRLAAHGVRMGYHNHDFEFKNGRLDRLFAACPELEMELDTYWAEHAGVPAAPYMKGYENRLALIHIKDMNAEPEKRNTNPNLYDGILDIDAIMGQAKAAGAAWAIVEMDEPEGDPVAAVVASIKSLNARGW